MRWHFGDNDKSETTNDKIADQPSAINHQLSAIRCPLCGKKFQAGEAAQCSSCAMAVKCGLVMCPNCSYEFVA